MYLFIYVSVGLFLNLNQSNIIMAVSVTSTGFVYKKKQLFDISKSNPNGQSTKKNCKSLLSRTGLNQSQPELASSESVSTNTESNWMDFKVVAMDMKEVESLKANRFKTFQKGRKWRLFDSSVANGFMDDGTAKTFSEKLETFEQYCKKSSKEKRISKIFQKNPAASRQNGSNKGDCKTGNSLNKWNSLPSFTESDKIYERPDANCNIEKAWCQETRFDLEVKGKSTLKKQNWAARFSYRLNLIRQKLESRCSSDKQDMVQRQTHFAFGGSTSILDLDTGRSGQGQANREPTDSGDTEGNDGRGQGRTREHLEGGRTLEHAEGRTREYPEYICEIKGELIYQRICQSMYLCTRWGTEHVSLYTVGDRACIFVHSGGQSIYLCMQWGTEHVFLYQLYAVGDRACIFVHSGGHSMYLCTQWGTEHISLYAVGDRACIFVHSGGQSMYLCMQWGTEHVSLYAVWDRACIFVSIVCSGGQSMYLCINCMQWGTEHVYLYTVGDRACIFVCSGGQSMYLCMQWGTEHVSLYAVWDRACIFVHSGGQSMYLCMQ